MEPRFAALPRSLAEKARIELLGSTAAPALLAHPDWKNPAPVVLWYHGRSVSKELDPGRYLRLIRAGIAVCAIDLPGHGQRQGPKRVGPEHSVEIVAEAASEVPGIVEALGTSTYAHLFDRSRIAIGGMSAGGMVSLRALCEPDHPFCGALVESTTGRLGELYQTDRHIMQREEDASVPSTQSPAPGRTKLVDRDHFPAHDPAAVAAIDPAAHLDTWPRAIPLLAIHSKLDAVVPFAIQQRFLDDLRVRYRELGADPSCIELLGFEKTGAPMEHVGFGKVGAQAKDAATQFLVRVLVDGQRCG